MIIVYVKVVTKISDAYSYACLNFYVLHEYFVELIVQSVCKIFYLISDTNGRVVTTASSADLALVER
jgi:hypothetical protein